MRGRRILVAGGAGFVGSNLVRRIVEQGGEAYVIDDFSTGRRGNLADNKDAVQVIRGDVVSEFAYLAPLIRNGIDAIIHLASRDRLNDVGTLSYRARTDIQGTLNLLHLAKEVGVGSFVFMSTRLSEHTAADFTEDISAVSGSPELIGKLVAERYTQLYQALWDVPTTIVRVDQVYGPYSYPDSSLYSVVSDIIYQAHQSGKIIINNRNFLVGLVYVEDVVNAILELILNGGGARVPLNYGMDQETNIYDLANRVARLTGSQIAVGGHDISEASNRELEKPLKGMRNSTSGGESQSQFTLDEGLERTIRWFQQTFPPRTS